MSTLQEDPMHQPKKHNDMQHKTPKKIKKYQKPTYKLDAPLKNPNVNEADWQLEQRKWKEKTKNQLR